MKKSTVSRVAEDGRNYANEIPMRLWAEDDLPETKLLLKGTHALSDAEILSLIIGNGIAGNTSLNISRTLLAACNNHLQELWKMSVADMCQVPGIGQGIAVRLAAMFSMCRREQACEAVIRDKISRSDDARRILASLMRDLPYEEFWILMLNRANKVIGRHRISEGGISGTVVDPKKIFKVCLDHHASSIILGHNHPSGVTTPSEADIRITKKIHDSGALLDIAVLDHIIIGGDQYYSFADDGAM